MRMTASWSGRYGPTEYKVVARYFAPDGKLPLGPLCCPSKKITGARSKSALTEKTIVHAEQDDDRKLPALCTVQSREDYAVASFSKAGKKAERHVGHVTIGPRSFNEGVQDYSIII